MLAVLRQDDKAIGTRFSTAIIAIAALFSPDSKAAVYVAAMAIC